MRRIMNDKNMVNAKVNPQGFYRDENGSLIIFGLFVLVLMLMIGGLAVDLMRYETNRARLQSTLDRAVLAAASLDQPMEPMDVVVDYFEKAGLSAYLDPGDVVVENTLTARRVTAEASYRVNSTFMRLMNINYMDALAGGSAEESASRTEISLVVDVSGSMNWDSASGNSKIHELREAATEFVNIIQCNPEDPDDTANCTVTPDTVSITLIPYSHQVLAGDTIFDQLTVTDDHTSSACITFVEDDFDLASMDPSELFTQTGHFDGWHNAGSTPTWWACSIDSWREITPLANEPEDMRTAISDLNAWGATSVDVGMKWGAAFLDPMFQPVVQGLVNDGAVDAVFEDRPYSYVENGIKKVIVLMTDGVNTDQPLLLDGYRSGPSGIWYTDWNNSYYTNSGHGGVQLTFPELWERKTISWYANQGMGWASTWNDTPTKNERLEAVCNAAKGQNVTVFTIGFEVTEESAVVMESCASSPAHFFDVEGSDLGEAFASIARAISALRLVN